MSLLSQTEGLVLLALFGVVMIALVWVRTHQEKHAEGFLAADRQVPAWKGAFSIAISWAWAPAIFICSMQAFNMGLPGIFWFTVPNIICFFVFVPIALRLRKLLPKGYTMPQFIYERYKGSAPVHLIFVVGYMLYMLSALVANAYAGGSLLHALSGVDLDLAIISMIGIALAYSFLSGLKASIFTDVIQMVMVLGLAIIIVPWCLIELGGASTIMNGLGGVTESAANRSVFNPAVAFAMGIPMSIALLTGPIGDQMFFQRTFAVKKEAVKKTFIWGGLLFGLIPITLSLLGFMGADLVLQGEITVSNPEMVGPVVVGYLLPKAALYAFTLMALAGLCSTLDSAFCALSALGGVDVYQRYVQPRAKDRRLLKASRKFMVGFAVLGLAIALLKPKLLWVFLTGGSVTAAVFFPVIFSLFWSQISARGAGAAVATSLLVGVPFTIYANVQGDANLIVLAAIVSVSLGLVVCVIDGVLNKAAPYQFKALN